SDRGGRRLLRLPRHRLDPRQADDDHRGRAGPARPRGSLCGGRRHGRSHHRSSDCAEFTATNPGTRSFAPNARSAENRRRCNQHTRGETMRNTLRPLAALAMVAMVAVFGAGCGGTRSGGDTRTAASHTPTAANHTSTTTAREKAVKFAACMRENGYPDFPDPKASGEFPAFGISVSPAVWTKALGACKELQPPGSFSAHLSPKQLSAALKFAQCIRANGVKDFPDPVNGQPIVDTTRIPSSNKPGGMTILNAAMKKCGDVLRLTGSGGTGG